MAISRRIEVATNAPQGQAEMPRNARSNLLTVKELARLVEHV